jgi:hypothetical protein
MKIKQLVVAAIALAALAPVASATDAAFQQKASQVSAKLAEGFSGISFVSRVKLTPANTWGEIKKKAQPAFPTVNFPDGGAYKVSSLCAEGDNLRVVDGYPRFRNVCVEERSAGESSVCVKYAKVELVTPRNYSETRCTASEWYKNPLDLGAEGGQPWSKRCTKQETFNLRHELKHQVAVYTPEHVAAEGMVITPAVLLFTKEYEIPSCN